VNPCPSRGPRYDPFTLQRHVRAYFHARGRAPRRRSRRSRRGGPLRMNGSCRPVGAAIAHGDPTSLGDACGVVVATLAVHLAARMDRRQYTTFEPIRAMRGGPVAALATCRAPVSVAVPPAGRARKHLLATSRRKPRPVYRRRRLLAPGDHIPQRQISRKCSDSSASAPARLRVTDPRGCAMRPASSSVLRLLARAHRSPPFNSDGADQHVCGHSFRPARRPLATSPWRHVWIGSPRHHPEGPQPDAVGGELTV